MNSLKKIARGTIAVALLLWAPATQAQTTLSRLMGGNANSPIAQAVTVPPGYITYYISGTPSGPARPDLPRTDPARMGDTPTQTTSSLNRLRDSLTQLGLTFGDVVKATVFLVGDPAKGGEIDFAGMNQSWSKEFGTPAQPNKPARSTIKVAGLATQGALVEIEMIAVKKAP